MSHVSTTAGCCSSEGSSSQGQCAKVCLECYQVCNETLQHCLNKGGEHSSLEHVNLLLDCARIWQTSADFLLRNSEQHTSTCRACAEICVQCAENCRSMKDTIMNKCADICEKCAKSCEEMISH